MEPHGLYEGNFADRDRKRFSLICYKKGFKIIDSKIVEDMSGKAEPYNALEIKKTENNFPQTSYIAFINCEDSLEAICEFTQEYGHLTENVNFEKEFRPPNNETLEPKPYEVNKDEFTTEQKKFKYIVKLYTCLHNAEKKPDSDDDLDFSESMFISLNNFLKGYNSIDQFDLPLTAKIKLDMLTKIIKLCNSSKDKILKIYTYRGKRLRKKFKKKMKGVFPDNPYDELHSVIGKYPELIKKIETGDFESGSTIWSYCIDDAKESILGVVCSTIENQLNQLRINLVPNQIKFDTVEYKGTLLSAMYFRFYFDIFMRQVGRTTNKNTIATIPIRICRNNECKKIFVSYYRYNKHFCSQTCGQRYRYILKENATKSTK